MRSTLPHNNECAIKTHLLNHLPFNNENENKTKAKSRTKKEREENNKIIERRASRRAHACSRVVASIVDINDKLVDALNSRCSHSVQSHESSEWTKQNECTEFVWGRNQYLERFFVISLMGFISFRLLLCIVIMYLKLIGIYVFASLSFSLVVLVVPTEHFHNNEQRSEHVCGAWECMFAKLFFFFLFFWLFSFHLARSQCSRIVGDELINSCRRRHPCRHIRMSYHHGMRINIFNVVRHPQPDHSHTLVPVRQRRHEKTLKSNRSFRAKITIIIINSPSLRHRTTIDGIKTIAILWWIIIQSICRDK